MNPLGLKEDNLSTDLESQRNKNASLEKFQHEQQVNRIEYAIRKENNSITRMSTLHTISHKRVLKKLPSGVEATIAVMELRKLFSFKSVL